MNTNDTVIISEAPVKAPKSNVGKIFNVIWQVFKGLFIAALILATIFNTFVSILYVQEASDPELHPIYLHAEVPYYWKTQDFEDLMEEFDKNPEGEKYKEMRKAFYAKYSVRYKDTPTYSELEELHKTKPDSEEYNQKLQELMDMFDITAEEITFDE